MVSFTTCLTRWVNSFWLSFGSVTVSVVVFRIVDVAAWVRGIGITVFVSRNILIIFSLLSLFFQQLALIFIMSWFFTVMARWFGSISICIYSIVAYSICSPSGASKPFSSNSLSRCVTICSCVPFSKWA